jgi:hypothetical protein
MMATGLPIDEYEQMLEDLHLIRVYNESREDERIPWEQIKDELIAEGRHERQSLLNHHYLEGAQLIH